MAEAFPGGRLVFDAAGKTAVKLIAKTWMKAAEIQDVNAFFSVSDTQELSRWDENIQPGVYARLSRSENTVRQQIFPSVSQGRRQNDENEDYTVRFLNTAGDVTSTSPAVFSC